MRNLKKIAGIHLKELAGMAAKHHSRNKKLVKALKAKGNRRSNIPVNLDDFIHEEHHRQFEKIDCLDCANCCKTTPALIIQEDMNRISGQLSIPVSEFMTSYVEMDEDGDFIFNSTPCPFLAADNRCGIYDVRPASCREYPLTLRNKQARILDISLANTAICPAVFRIFEKLEDAVLKSNR